MLSHSFKLKNKLCNAFAAISITLVGIKIHLFVIFKVVTQKRPQIHRAQGNKKKARHEVHGFHPRSKQRATEKLLVRGSTPPGRLGQMDDPLWGSMESWLNNRPAMWRTVEQIVSNRLINIQDFQFGSSQLE